MRKASLRPNPTMKPCGVPQAARLRKIFAAEDEAIADRDNQAATACSAANLGGAWAFSPDSVDSKISHQRRSTIGLIRRGGTLAGSSRTHRDS